MNASPPGPETGQKGTLPPREKAIFCARKVREKKAYGVMILHMGPLTSIAEYFVICSGRSVRQTRAIANHLRSDLKKKRTNPLGIEGEKEGCWILLDYDEVVVHVFHEPTREIYGLEKLWSDASVLDPPELHEKDDIILADGYSEDEEDWEE